MLPYLASKYSSTTSATTISPTVSWRSARMPPL
jgi:hypothetical protein